MNKWDIHYLGLAIYHSVLSKDPRTKVGCVITNGKESPVLGYNGLPKNIEDSEQRLNDYDTKHKLVIHAELNAIMSSNRSLKNNTLYCTHPPCIRCTVNIIQKEISKVVCVKSSNEKMIKHKVDIELSKQLFTEAGIDFLIHEKEELIRLITQHTEGT